MVKDIKTKSNLFLCIRLFLTVACMLVKVKSMKSQNEHCAPPSCSSWLSFPLLLPSSNIPSQQDLKCPNSKQSLWAFLHACQGRGALQVSTSPGKCAQTQRETSPDCLITQICSLQMSDSKFTLSRFYH